MLSSLTLTVIIVIIAIVFDTINGFHDSANAIACCVSTRVMTMREAVLMSASLNFMGAFMSVKVAETVGNGIVNPNDVTQEVIIAALMGAIIWNLITWYFGIPSSSSHALIGGLVGSAVVYKSSFLIINWSGLFWKVILWLILSPIIGFIVGYIFMNIMNLVLRNTRPRVVTKVFSKAQIFSAMLVALNHGGNDAQKTMGIITMTLVSAGFLAEFSVPLWVKICCALSMALGTSLGGKKIIKTMGSKMAKMAPINGFSAEMGASAVIFTATMFDAPVSTTHIITTAIMGVGSAKRFSAVRWSVAKDIVVTWIFTIPSCAVISGILIFLLSLF
ncbi:inorganic phosphate transporter [Clostridium luticellarii]|jgi:PiT family inorganic phosphate transporter|uniref:Low-affinity inorganic phosphate transporter 1 n=1 Tax=Clostridium luticellarii TaxID=1691940 RepID=A0A2T0BRF2_9CLOT|nr:inorganic phosphate transporter [Clostridium luticellarii]MCI1943844.1 inorganic phosphate transporter [Clostridium luticellarii]MCI1967105.1 inorganic phosphate transporter [Clostridium luticellarii]MCI1994472.1 inorganic phosphate transporter [Clostridium luticellarii]MCI2038575.1 inorganic phosphate transporter [Clostridium luticellarii]PRR86449.1 Low-affinity inorganic phosphate transporter 1 [Clostridium luticellarii]